MTSRGGASYDRTFLEAFVRPGPDRQNWSPRNNYAAHGLLETRPGEISLYYTRHYAQPTNHVERFSLRTDGFASLSAGRPGGTARSKPLTFAGDRLILNYATAAAGEIRVQLSDPLGRPLPGHAFADCDPLTGDELSRPVTWRGSADLAPWSGTVIRAEFAMEDADLFSLQFPASVP
jgi:hypothetical protein